MTPRPDIEAIRQTLRHFVSPGQLGEVRIIRSIGSTSGFFFWHDEIDEAAQLAAELDPQAKGVYVVINEIDPAILDGRDTLTVLFGGLTKDENIARRRQLLIDCDPKSAERGADDSATDDEKTPSGIVREAIYEFLAELGFPEPAFCDSGNGVHMLFAVDLPNDEESKQLVKAFLESLAKRFSTDQVGVDISVSNAARITKLYGTVARKGEDRPDRPHRLSQIQSLPDGGAETASKELIVKAIRELTTSGGTLLDREQSTGDEPSGLIGNLGDFTLTKPKLILPEQFPEGGRHANLIAVAGAARSFGSNEVEILEILRTFNRTRCANGKPDDELRKIARDYSTKDVNLPMKALIECDSEEKIESAERQQKLKQAIDYASRQIASGNNPGEVIVKLRTVIEEFSTQDQPRTFRTMTSAELDAADLHTEYLVSDVLARQQSTIIAAAKKSLKTSIAIDLTLSLASRCYFLGKFHIPTAVRVALMSGESGDATIQETARRIARSKIWPNLSDYEDAVWSFDLPRLGHPQTKRELAKFIADQGLEVLIIDPAYLCLDLGDDAGNLFSVGKKLRELTDIQHETGCTIVIIHHNVKSKGDPFAVPELESIAWSGFQEWARQWLLIGRREAYNPEQAGSHRLWLSAGGSAGHSGLWGLDIEEGSRTDQGGRRWEVSIDGAGKVIAENISEREQSKAERSQAKADRQIAADAAKMLATMQARFSTGETERTIREAAGVPGTRAGLAITKLLADGSILPCDVIKTQRTYPGFKPVSEKTGTSGTQWDKDRDNNLCPSGVDQSGTTPLEGVVPVPLFDTARIRDSGRV